MGRGGSQRLGYGFVQRSFGGKALAFPDLNAFTFHNSKGSQKIHIFPQIIGKNDIFRLLRSQVPLICSPKVKFEKIDGVADC
jgi:hypothetical protein